MKRMWLFAKRNTKEITRDPLSYIFCVGLPIVMLVIFRIIEHYSGGAAVMFELRSLAPGIIVFSYCFVMLYLALLVSKDKSSSFLSRLFTSPMLPGEFLFGYALPGMVIGVAQTVLCFAAASLLGIIDGVYISAADMAKTVAVMLPMLLCYVSLGILFGALLSDKAAPGICSLIISLSGFLSGAWMPVETMGDYETVCRFLPFYPAVSMGRVMTMGKAVTFDTFWLGMITVAVYAAVISVSAVLAFGKVMRRDNK